MLCRSRIFVLYQIGTVVVSLLFLGGVMRYYSERMYAQSAGKLEHGERLNRQDHVRLEMAVDRKEAAEQIERETMRLVARNAQDLRELHENCLPYGNDEECDVLPW